MARISCSSVREWLTVAYGPRYPITVVYALRSEGQSLLCFETVLAVTNAFNLAHHGLYEAMPEVEAGGSWEAGYRITAAGF